MVYVNSIDHIIKGHESGVDNCIFLPHPQKACGILMMDKKYLFTVRANPFVMFYQGLLLSLSTVN